MKKKDKILFIGKSKDIFSKKFYFILKKNFKNVLAIYDNHKNHKKIRNKIKRWNGNYIIAFRSSYLFKHKDINVDNRKIINFHPGPPEYRGIGCINFALLRGEKFYGATSHLIDSIKIDAGKIINVKKWRIKKKESIDEILNKTYEKQLLQLKNIIRYIKEKKLSKLIFQNKNIKWSKTLYTKKKLEKLYTIKTLSEKNISNILRATVTKKFKPYILLGGKRFIYEN